MENLQSLPHESSPGIERHLLPYALLKRSREKPGQQNSGLETLWFNVAATKLAGFKQSERVNLYWDEENMLVGLMRGGTHRSVHVWRSQGRTRRSEVYITSLVRLFQIPFHRHPLSVSVDPDKNVWIDFSGEPAHERYVPMRIRKRDPAAGLTEQRVARLAAYLSDGSRVNCKEWPTLLKLFQNIAWAEGYSNFSQWLDTVLVHYVQDHHPALWEAFVEGKSNGNQTR